MMGDYYIWRCAVCLCGDTTFFVFVVDIMTRMCRFYWFQWYDEHGMLFDVEELSQAFLFLYISSEINFFFFGPSHATMFAAEC